MDQTNLNTILGIVAIAISLASAIFAGILARNDIIRMRRKPLVFETQAKPVQGQPDWSEVRITIRNFEPVTAKIVAVKIKAPALLLDEESHEGVAWAPTLKNPLPLATAKRSIPVNFRLRAKTSASDGWKDGSTEILTLYAYRWSGPESLSYVKRWGDE